MAEIAIAHLREQGQDMIIVPLKPEFGRQPRAQQNETIDQLQFAARAAGLKGTVVPVWDAGGGRMAFISPRPWQNFFRNMNLRWVAANLNKKLIIR